MANVLATRTKDPTEVKDYGFSWLDWLNENDPDDTISTSTFTVPVGLIKNSQTNNTTTTTVWLSGGTDGSDYAVVNQIVTAGGRTAEQAMLIRIRSVG